MGSPLESFVQRTGMIWLVFSKHHSDFWEWVTGDKGESVRSVREAYCSDPNERWWWLDQDVALEVIRSDWILYVFEEKVNRICWQIDYEVWLQDFLTRANFTGKVKFSSAEMSVHFKEEVIWGKKIRCPDLRHLSLRCSSDIPVVDNEGTGLSLGGTKLEKKEIQKQVITVTAKSAISEGI